MGAPGGEMTVSDSRHGTPELRRPPLLEGRCLQKWYGGLAALKGIDMVVYPGEMVGVVGPNGSGKTTLFDCLTRMEGVNSGQVFFKGSDITRSKPFHVARMGLSRTFQSIRVYRKLTVLENMMLSRDWSGERLPHWLRPSAASTMERADELLEFLTLDGHRAAPAGSLSWGQQRLLEIGMVLMPDPGIMLLDEATSGVNPALVEVIKERILTLNRKEGKTILLIEHNIDVVADLCERVVVLDYGELLAEGTVDAVFQNPAVIEAYLGKYHPES
jgi:ABC-type branched-subunit amino acid transport system ATPase component